MNTMLKEVFIKKLLCFSVFFIFLGRAWQFFFWDAPYRAFFWDEELLKPLVESLFQISWYEYVTSETTDAFIQNVIFSTAVLYGLAAISTLLYYKFKKNIFKYIIFLGALNIVVLSYLLMKEKFFYLAQFFEQTVQFSLPLIYVFFDKTSCKSNIIFLKICTAIVFLSHGLYAVGYYPVPGKFVDMIIQIFAISEEMSIQILLVAGLIDFLVAILIFVPIISRVALFYAFVWGTLTALARIVSKFDIHFPIQTLHQELLGTVYRLAHGFVPLIILLLERSEKEQ
jgi:hypothetical protein